MAQTWPELMAKARHADIAREQLLGELLAAETAEREVRSIAYQMTAAASRRTAIWLASALPSRGSMGN